jgi:hypothetical protein
MQRSSCAIIMRKSFLNKWFWEMVVTCTIMLVLQNGKSLLMVLTYDVSLKYFVNVLLIKSTRYQNKMLAINTKFAKFVLWSNQWHVLSVLPTIPPHPIWYWQMKEENGLFECFCLMFNKWCILEVFHLFFINTKERPN